jgi:predicted RNA-binding Zn-ribbon protein involved in translation (DUF1610 family)
MDECVYFTRRKVDSGRVVAWVFREECPVCHKALMGKPVDEKTGKVKTRASEYVCPECNHTVPKQEYEDSLTCNIQYVCPKCKFEGEIQVPFKRRKFQILDKVSQKKKPVDAIVFNCEKCEEKIPITKKLKG